MSDRQTLFITDNPIVNMSAPVNIVQIETTSTCPICTDIANDNTINCDTCLDWFHYKCESKQNKGGQNPNHSTIHVPNTMMNNSKVPFQTAHNPNTPSFPTQTHFQHVPVHPHTYSQQGHSFTAPIGHVPNMHMQLHPQHIPVNQIYQQGINFAHPGHNSFTPVHQLNNSHLSSNITQPINQLHMDSTQSLHQRNSHPTTKPATGHHSNLNFRNAQTNYNIRRGPAHTKRTYPSSYPESVSRIHGQNKRDDCLYSSTKSLNSKPDINNHSVDNNVVLQSSETKFIENIVVPSNETKIIDNVVLPSNETKFIDIQCSDPFLDKGMTELDIQEISSDCNFPKVHSVRSRGNGGVLIGWNSKFDSYVKTLNDGNERIIAVEINCSPKSICLINCYLPTSGYTDTAVKYQDSLDLLEIIIHKYCESHQIILAGDMNATLLLSRRNDSDRRFRSFIDKHKLETLTNIGITPTYQHGIGSSQIDYIFSHSDDIILEVEICQQHPTNTSSHIPVVGKIKTILSLTQAKTDKPPERRRYLWNNCDIELYQSTLSNSQLPIIERPDQIKTFVDQLNDNILAAAKKAVPSRKI
ncbi:unnamed protein product [Mytilus coruscus]|uniref:Endonuclease/exonuclease/phosphatase domain-containing protein n=1 Tax=Mytilus coruscus TaxID=42192 RepID=A0A6J8CA25_MYTCO|nr:unnamed protein product [Mytilus coruscus]